MASRVRCSKVDPMTDYNADDYDRTANEIRADVLGAAGHALKNSSRDSTGSASYNRRRGYETGFDAAMAELREVPLEERPDGLVEEVDELCSIVHEDTREEAADALLLAAGRAKSAVFHDLAEGLDKGDRVEYSYRPPEDEERVTREGTVCKSNRGGIRILRDDERYLHTVKLGRVTSTHPDGGALRRDTVIGEEAEVEATGETRPVTYEQRSGWTHEEPAEA